MYDTQQMKGMSQAEEDYIFVSENHSWIYEKFHLPKSKSIFDIVRYNSLLLYRTR